MSAKTIMLTRGGANDVRRVAGSPVARGVSELVPSSEKPRPSTRQHEEWRVGALPSRGVFAARLRRLLARHEPRRHSPKPNMYAHRSEMYLQRYSSGHWREERRNLGWGVSGLRVGEWGDGASSSSLRAHPGSPDHRCSSPTDSLKRIVRIHDAHISQRDGPPKHGNEAQRAPEKGQLGDEQDAREREPCPGWGAERGGGGCRRRGGRGLVAIAAVRVSERAAACCPEGS